jgi:hypothetical protein
MQAFDCNGIWWSPETPSERVAGVLRFSDETGIVVALSGALGEPAAPFQTKAIPILFGLIYDCPLGSLVTLKGCRVQTVHLSTPGFLREDYFADRLFIGAHLEEQDFLFAELIVSFSGLPSWADVLTGLENRPLPAAEGQRHGFEIRWLQPEPISGRVPGGTVTLGARASFSMSRRTGSITEDVQVRIVCDSPEPEGILHEKYVYPLKNLMTLATDHPNAVTEFTVRRPDSRESIRVLATRVFHDVGAAADLSPHKMLFSLEDVKDRAIRLIGRWIEVAQRLRGVCNPYFGILDKPDTFVDVTFLAVYQALEVYDRIRNGVGESATPSGPSRAEHLARLLNEHRATIGPLFGDDLPEAAGKLLRFRNFIVHHDSALGQDPDYSRDLFWLTQRLMFLMKACFLTELGISSEEQSKFFRRNQMYVHILGLPGA